MRKTIIVCGAFLSLTALASDHIDGPVTTKHRVGDITDLYAFPTPNKPGSVSMVLNAYPLVGSKGHFSDKVDYTFVVRRAERKDSQVATSDEVKITCRFKTPDNTDNNSMSCKSSNGLNAEGKYNKVEGKHEGDDFRVYAGMRSDPFFFNADFANKLSIEGKLTEPKDDNVMDNTNILSVAIEIDAKKLYKENTPAMLAFAAESTTKDSGTAPARRLDWVGRPEITNVGMVNHKGEADLRDQYNREKPFSVPEKNKKLYRDQLTKNIGFYDQADGKQNWKVVDKLKMGEILADDFLLLDTSKPCEKDNFLEIEKAMVEGRAHTTCGGRKITDDIMDTYFSMYVSGIGGKPIQDGVNKPQAKISAELPYLGEPDLSLITRIKTFAKKKYLGIEAAPDGRPDELPAEEGPADQGSGTAE